LVHDVGLLVSELGEERGYRVVDKGQFFTGELDVNHVENATVDRLRGTRD
jgi:hypothetical protein